MMQYEAALKARYREAEKRVKYPPAWRPKPMLVELPLPIHCVAPRLPEWQGKDISFDAHVEAWLFWNARQAWRCTDYAKARAIELGFTYELMQTESRTKLLVFARQRLMWEIKVKFNKSLAEIGRMFGDRDHTTVLCAVRKMERLKAEGRI